MWALEVSILRIISDDFPGLVECELVDASGQSWLFIEKIPVVSSEHIWLDSEFPQPGFIACSILSSSALARDDLVEVETDGPWGIRSLNDHSRFVVRPGQIVEIVE